MRSSGLYQAGAAEERGESARESTFIGAIAVADLVKSTLGPKGMDKILVSSSNDGEFHVSNDGATILRSINLDNAAAKVLVEIAKVQDNVVGDGTTSVCVLAGELMREGEKLIDAKVHPQTIIKGYRLAESEALKALSANALDNSGDDTLFRESLLNLARTTLSSKILNQEKDLFSKLAVAAVLRLRGSTDLDMIHIIKKIGGTLGDSFLDDGFILEKKIGVGQPKRVENARILIANTPMDSDRVKIFGARVRVCDPDKVADIEKEEREKMISKCEKILASGCSAFINRQLIYNLPESIFAKNGCLAIEHADFEGVERLAKVLGGDIASTFDHIDQVCLGTCQLIDEIMLGEDRVIRFSGCFRNEACTIVLRGSSEIILNEAERSLHDALCVISQTVKHKKTVLGAGCAEMLMAHAVDRLANTTGGKTALAVEAYARALRKLPYIVADNAGLDAAELIAQLRAEHSRGNSHTGLDIEGKCVGDVRVLGVTESFIVKSNVVSNASEAAELLLRVDVIVTLPKRQRDRDPRLNDGRF